MITDQGLKRLLMAMYGREELNLPEGEELGYVKANVEHAIADMIRLRGYPAEMALRNRRILYGRFGLDDDEPMTFKELAKNADLSAGRVRQIVVQMLRSLRHPALLGRGPTRLGITISQQIFEDR